MKLIVQPDAGITPVITAIKLAKKAIDIMIFRLDRTEITRALERAVARGVAVRALIAHTNSGGEGRCGNWNCGSSSRASASRGRPTIWSATTAR